jgi:hypothetical protein
MRKLMLALTFAFVACGGDTTPSNDLSAPADLSANACGLATINNDCFASCGEPDGGASPGGPGWPCGPDPVCQNGHWKFDCLPH